MLSARLFFTDVSQIPTEAEENKMDRLVSECPGNVSL